MVQDPVCKIVIEKNKAKTSFDYKGRTYFFCSEECKEEFIKNPEKYMLKPRKPENSEC